MPSEEIREWLGLTRADLFVYLSGAAVIAMLLIEVPIVDLALALTALALSLKACASGMKTSSKVSPLANLAKKLSYPAGVVLVLLFAVGDYLKLSYYQIPENGMFPGMPASSRLLAFKKPYRDPSEVSRGDIVVFTRTEDDQSYTYVWRVVGLPEDDIRISGDELMINGRKLAHEKTRQDGEFVIYKEVNGNSTYDIAYSSTQPASLPRDMTFNIPAGHFFVLGDNRDHAHDSRYFGPIPFDSIVARKWQ